MPVKDTVRVAVCIVNGAVPEVRGPRGDKEIVTGCIRE